MPRTILNYAIDFNNNNMIELKQTEDSDGNIVFKDGVFPKSPLFGKRLEFNY